MPILKIVLNPNPSLREIAAEVSQSEIKNGSLKQTIVDMVETMFAKDGVGLAAPQVSIAKRLIIVNTKQGALAMINPTLSKLSFGQEWDEEGCLSLPHTFGKVKRHKSIRCEFITEQGDKKKIEAKGLLARIIQHEIDHLDGILFIDKAKDITENTYNL
ncbi:MAG: peptide deformylase [Candidatus Falkowbacteria bacterium]